MSSRVDAHAKGQTVQVLKNNLFIAPIFEHPPPPTDFLFIKHTFQMQTRFYLRVIPRIFCVGQTFPLIEVPPPHSRKMKAFIRDRVKIFALRLLLKKAPGRRMKFDKVICGLVVILTLDFLFDLF